MTLPIERTTISVRTTEPRMTPVPAGRRFVEALAQGGRAILQGAVGAVSFVPGGAALAATLRGAVPQIGGSSTPSPGGVDGASVEGPGAGPASPGGTGGAAGGDDLLARGQEMSMRFLQLQEAISSENRRYTALSNVLHARHEMAKNAIGNIR